MQLLEEKYTWDFWWVERPSHEDYLFYFLNADASLVATEQHHFASQVGVASTPDFRRFGIIRLDALAADANGWDNASIWSGHVVRFEDAFFCAYTSRDKSCDDGFTQKIGFAESGDGVDWNKRRDVPLVESQPDWYLTKSDPLEDTIHAWRDPFLFSDGGNWFMLIAAKDKRQPVNRRGCIAIASADTIFGPWTVHPPLLSPGAYGEMEVPQIYRTKDRSSVVCFSTKAECDHSDRTKGEGGFIAIEFQSSIRRAVMERGRRDVLIGEEDVSYSVVSPYREGLFACRVAPDLRGEVIGFPQRDGGVSLSSSRLFVDRY